MSARSLLQLYADRPDRVGGDRLEILTTLSGGPSFDPVYRPDIIKIPRGHAVYRWECVVEHCERTRSGGADMCTAHLEEWVRAREAGGARKAAFVSAAEGLDRHERAEQAACQVCPGRPAAHTRRRLCQRHMSRFRDHRAADGDEADLGHWLAGQDLFEGYGVCRSLSARTWPPRRLACAQGTRPATRTRAGQAGHRCPGTGRTVSNSKGWRFPSPSTTNSGSLTGAHVNGRRPGPGRSTCEGSGRCCGRRSGGRSSPTVSSNGPTSGTLDGSRSWRTSHETVTPGRSPAWTWTTSLVFTAGSPSRCCIT